VDAGLEQPKLVKVWVGWAAVGDGWAVYAPTMQEAIRRFHAADQVSGDSQGDAGEDHRAEVSEDMRVAD
jgi:hypothetical protein